MEHFIFSQTAIENLHNSSDKLLFVQQMWLVTEYFCNFIWLPRSWNDKKNVHLDFWKDVKCAEKQAIFIWSGSPLTQHLLRKPYKIQFKIFSFIQNPIYHFDKCVINSIDYIRRDLAVISYSKSVYFPWNENFFPPSYL